MVTVVGSFGQFTVLASADWGANKRARDRAARYTLKRVDFFITSLLDEREILSFCKDGGSICAWRLSTQWEIVCPQVSGVGPALRLHHEELRYAGAPCLAVFARHGKMSSPDIPSHISQKRRDVGHPSFSLARPDLAIL
jgi:hypothetical protein